jgi:hypothetical protein
MTRSSKGKRGYNPREVATREIKQTFLIVCEGSKTEPNYFRGFRFPGLVIEIKGLAVSPVQLVAEANQLVQGKEYDQVWCVFDRDDWPIDNFTGALSKARAKGIKVAYTNEAFELWYLLHFNYHDTAIGREKYKAKLTENLGKTYFKNDPTIYSTLKAKTDTAIHNAKRLFAQYEPPNPAEDNPSTTVHLLVEQLLRFSR